MRWLKMKVSIKEISEKLKTANKTKLAATVGLIGVVLIVIPYLFPSGQKAEETVAVVGNSNDRYVEETENKLEEALSDMLGGTKVKVMITLENGIRYVYASETKNDKDISEDKTTLKTQQSDSEQSNYIVIKNKEGNEEPLIVTEIAPAVKGCIVVCESGDSASVAGAVKQAAATSLGIDEEKICVIGRFNKEKTSKSN